MRYCIKITGKVQGVFFRKFAKEKADELKVTGIVKNLNDGSVYAEAEGGNMATQMFLDWCGIGSPQAVVTSVDVEMKEKIGYTDFRILK
jgi:acylphosphatase